MISCFIVVISRVFDNSEGRSPILVIYLMNNLYIYRTIKFILIMIKEIKIIIFLLFIIFILVIFSIIIIIIIIIFIFLVLLSIIPLISYYILEWIIRTIIITEYPSKWVFVNSPIWALFFFLFFCSLSLLF